MTFDWTWIVVVFLLAPGLFFLMAVVIAGFVHGRRPPRKASEERDV